MASYDGTVNVNASPNQVWDLVSGVNNFQNYFPNATSRQAETDDLLLFEWTVGGRTLQEKLWFNHLPEQQRFEWGSQGSDDFHGYVDVHRLGTDEAEVDMHLEAPAVGEDQVRQTVQQALDHIKQVSESGRLGRP